MYYLMDDDCNIASMPFDTREAAQAYLDKFLAPPWQVVYVPLFNGAFWSIKDVERM